MGPRARGKRAKQTGDDDGDRHDEGPSSAAALGRQSDLPKAGEPPRVAHHDWHERSMARVARPNRQAKRREEILDAAIALIERHDLATLRIADIAAELEITPQAVRYYFKDMHHLLSALALRSAVRFYADRIAVVEHTK